MRCWLYVDGVEGKIWVSVEVVGGCIKVCGMFCLGKCDADYMFRVLRAKSGSMLTVVGNVYARVF